MKNLILILALCVLSFSCAHKAPDVPGDVPPVVIPEPTPVPEPVPTPVPSEASWYIPKPMTKFAIIDNGDGDWVKQLAGKDVELAVVEAVPGKDDPCDIGYAEIAAKIQKLKATGRKISCYQSLSYESWRCDMVNFPKSAIGNKMQGWSELWSDWRATSAAHAFWDNRYDQFAKIGCDCVEDDNEVDPNDNDTGFPFTPAQAEAASKRRAEYAHKLGMCHLAKNNPSISLQKSRHSDGVMIEQARKYEEQDKYLPWKDAGKFGAMIEYSRSNCKPYSGFSVQYHPGGDYFDAKNFKVCE